MENTTTQNETQSKAKDNLFLPCISHFKEQCMKGLEYSKSELKNQKTQSKRDIARAKEDYNRAIARAKEEVIKARLHIENAKGDLKNITKAHTEYIARWKEQERYNIIMESEGEYKAYQDRKKKEKEDYFKSKGLK